MTALTDQAIAKIKDLIMSGEFAAGAKLPKEQDLSQRLGLSRNSLREAVRALTLIGVLEPRVGDGTYVTSLEPELLLTGMGFISDLLTGSTLLELHQVRRILEPVATEMAATRLDEDGLAALERCLADMDAAETTQAFIAADEEFHRIIVAASGNSTLASLIQNLSGGTLRARLWRSVTEQDAIEVTKRRHWDIYNALRDRDAERARAADLIHLSEGVRWLEQLIEAEEAIGALGGGGEGVRIADRLAQREAAQHQREGEEAEQRVRDRDHDLHADREREQRRVGRLAREDDDDQRLLRADAARGEGQQRRGRADDEHEQRVPDVGVDAERAQQVEHRADAADPADRLRHRDLHGVAAGLAQDREALAHPLAEVARDADRVAQEQQAEQHEHAHDDPGQARVADRRRELERRQVRQLRDPREDTLEVGVCEQARSDDGVEQGLDEQRRNHGRDARLGQAQADEVELQQIAAAGGDQRVEPDAGEIGAGARAPAIARVRVGGAQDRVPGARPQEQVHGVEEERDRERARADLAEPVEERLARVDEGVDVTHRVDLTRRGGRLGELPLDHDLGPGRGRDEAVALGLGAQTARDLELAAADHDPRTHLDGSERISAVIGTPSDRALDRARVLLDIDVRMIGVCEERQHHARGERRQEQVLGAPAGVVAAGKAARRPDLDGIPAVRLDPRVATGLAPERDPVDERLRARGHACSSSGSSVYVPSRRCPRGRRSGRTTATTLAARSRLISTSTSA